MTREEIHKLPWKAQEYINELQRKLTLTDVSQQRGLLIAYEKGHYTEQEWVLVKEQCVKEISIHLAINCG